ncbi:MAG: TorF family putative porin [Panacagrimonas sp.]
MSGRWRIAACMTFAFGAAFPACSQAEPGWHGLAKLSSDYLVRSYSKSGDGPVLQTNIDFLARNGLYAGLWLSSVDFGGARAEAIAYAGRKHRFSDNYSADLSVAGYGYDREVFGRRADYAEVYSALHFRDRATLGLSLAPDAYGSGHTVTNAQLEWRLPLGEVIEGSLVAGYESAARAYHYDDIHWQAGLSWFASRHTTIELRYYGARRVNGKPYLDTEGGDLGDTTFDDRIVLSVSFGQ